MSSSGLDQNTFNVDRPSDLRRSPPWARLAYIVGKLPLEIEKLVPDLEVTEGARVLDYGCADAPYRRLFGPGVEYVAADLPGNRDATVEIAADGTVPIDDASVDAVISTQVLEHVADPAVYLSECHRVLRPGGRLLLTTHGIMVYHPDPVDLWRWTCAGLERVVVEAGFEVVRLEGIMGLAATGLQLVQESVYFQLPRALRAPVALLFQTLARFADRLQGAESRRINALVFALVAERRG